MPGRHFGRDAVERDGERCRGVDGALEERMNRKESTASFMDTREKSHVRLIDGEDYGNRYLMDILLN